MPTTDPTVGGAHSSNAQWPDGTIGTDGDISTDRHWTLGAAEAVCKRLMAKGLGGDGRIFPIRVWTDPVLE